jgi:hypothetical protein
VIRALRRCITKAWEFQDVFSRPKIKTIPQPQTELKTKTPPSKQKHHLQNKNAQWHLK